MAEVLPLRVLYEPGPDPIRLSRERRSAGSRAEILDGLDGTSRGLVCAVVAALELLASVPKGALRGGPSGMAVSVLLRAFVDATGVPYVGSAWDSDG